MQAEKDRQGKNKDYPTRESMKKAFSLGRVPVVDQKPRAHYAQAIGQDRNR
jgi:hypothetical protein